VSLCKEGPDETDDRSPGGEDVHNVGASPDFLAQSILWVAGPDLFPVRLSGSAPFVIRALTGQGLLPDCGCFDSQATRNTRWLFLRDGGLLALATTVGVFVLVGLVVMALVAGSVVGVVCSLYYGFRKQYLQPIARGVGPT